MRQNYKGMGFAAINRFFISPSPEIDWKNVKGLRDIIAHHYFEVDADQIWWIIENELQPLKKAIQEMIESLKRILDE